MALTGCHLLWEVHLQRDFNGNREKECQLNNIMKESLPLVFALPWRQPM